MPSNPPSADGLARSGGKLAAMLVQERLLGRRLVVQAMARFVVAALMVVAALAARSLAGVASLDVVAIVALAVAIALYDTIVLAVIRSVRDAGSDANRAVVYRATALGSIALDFLALTVALWFVGGVRSPFLAFYLLHIGIASIVLSRRSAYLAALLAAVLLIGLVTVEVTGLLPPPLPQGAVAGDAPLDPRYVAAICVAYLGMFGLVVVAQTQLAEALRRREHAAEDRAEQFEKLSRMRRDFLHVALHDISAPIATSQQLLRNLRDGLCGAMGPRQREQVERALAKLEGMEHLLKEVRLLGELESADLAAHSSEIPLAFLLDSVVEEHADAAHEKQLSIAVEPSDSAAIVFGVPRLVREAIGNYVANAIKYTLPGGAIVARVRARDGAFRVEVSDTGVGIAPADQPRLFKEFARVGRGRPELKGVHGTGLGLSIVRRIAEAHGGRVGVESAPGEGSTFWVEFPACKGSEETPRPATP
ncbi:MAG: HAMP domain-containing sensor histidine kinase [Phycisphaerales bacterium]